MEGPATAGGVWFRPVASATGTESTAGRSHNKAKSASDKQGCRRESAVELGARAGERAALGEWLPLGRLSG